MIFLNLVLVHKNKPKKQTDAGFLIFQIILLVIFYGPAVCAAATLFQDNFNDNSIDSNKWTYAGNTVSESSQQLQVKTTVTDKGGHAESLWVPINPSKEIFIKKKAYLHYGNNRFIGKTCIMTDKTSPSQLACILYGNMDYYNSIWCAAKGIYIAKGNKGPHYCSNSSQNYSTPIIPLWNQWFDEEIAYNPITGLLRYYINGVNKKEFNIGAIPATTQKIKIYFDSWGWWTGHYHYVDDLSITQDDHVNGISQATAIGVDSRTGGQIDRPGDEDYFRVEVGTAGKLTLSSLGTTDTYGYLLNSAGNELARNDDTSATNRNFQITRSLSPGTYYVRARHFSSSGTGAYTLAADFIAANGKAQRAVLLLHGMNSDTNTWNTLATSRWSGVCKDIYNGVASASGEQPRDALGAICYRLRFGRYDTTGSTGLENLRCSSSGNPVGCKGDFTAIYSTGNDLGVEVFAAVRAILRRLGSDTQVVLLGHSRGGLAARAFMQRPVKSAEHNAVVGLVTTGTPHRGSPLGRIYPYLQSQCLDGTGRRIHSGNKAGKPGAVWSACEDDWEAVDFLKGRETPLDLRMPTIDFLASGSSQIKLLNSGTSLANLPLGLPMVQLRYKGQYLGHITFGYAAWDHLGSQGGEQFSGRSRGYVLCPATPSNCNLTEKDPEFDGDGIVPSSSQTISYGGRPNIPVEGQAGTYHMTVAKEYGGLVGGTTGEPDRVGDINKALEKVTWPQ